MYVILSFLGVLYILEVINKNLYKILPSINIDFLSRKLGITEVSSLKEYIMVRIQIYKGLKSIKNVSDADISNFDLEALEELEQYLKNELNGYVQRLMVRNISMLDQVSNHIQCTLNHGILEFYLSQDNSFINDIGIKFQSFSEDCPSLEVSTKNTSYTYKIKSKHIRFLNPDVKQIHFIKEILKTMELNNNINQALQLQVAA